MITKEERLAYCNKCIHKKESERYGVLCGLTDNYPHFSDKCKDYKSTGISPELPKFQDFVRANSKEKKDRGKSKSGSWIGKGIVIYIVFRFVLKLIKYFVNNY